METSLNISKFFLAAPEIFLAVWILFFIVLGLFSGGEKPAKQSMFTLFAVLGLSMTFMLIYTSDWRAARALSDLFVQDRMAVFMKLFVTFMGICILFISEKYRTKEKLFLFEYPLLILFSILGMLIMISANDFISLYMGLELQSLSLYVLAAIKKDSSKSSEAGLKFFITARAEVRAKRRYNELRLKGDDVLFEDILLNINKRDVNDTSRLLNPLIKTDDAILIDNSDIPLAQFSAT